MFKFKFRVTVICLFIAFVASGCGNSSSSEQNTVNGKNAPDYYNDLTYKSEDTGTGTWYHYLYSTLKDTVLLRRDDGKSIDAGFSLFLKKDKTYVLIYREVALCDNGGGASTYYLTYRQDIRGTWHVDGTNIVLNDLARGSGIQINSDQAIGFKFSRNLHREGLTEATPILLYGTTNQSLEDQTLSAETEYPEERAFAALTRNGNCKK